MAANQLVNEIVDGVIRRKKLKNVNEPTSNRLCPFSAFPSIKYKVCMCKVMLMHVRIESRYKLI